LNALAFFAALREREGRSGAVDRREVVSATDDPGTEKTDAVGERGEGAEALRCVLVLVDAVAVRGPGVEEVGASTKGIEGTGGGGVCIWGARLARAVTVRSSSRLARPKSSSSSERS
jgi:hypothetical protein